MRRPGIAATLAFADFLALGAAIGLAGATAWLLTTQVFDAPYQAFGATDLQSRLWLWFDLAVALCIWFGITGTYTTRRTVGEDINRTIGVLSIAFLIDGFVEFATRQHFSRMWVMFVWPFAALLIPLARIGARRMLDAAGHWRIAAAIFGSGESFGTVANHIEENRYFGYFVAYHAKLPGDGDPPLSTLTAEITAAMKLRGAETAILVPSLQEMGRLDRVIDALNLSLTPYILVPPVQRLPVAGLAVQATVNADAILMTSRQGLISPTRRATKRLFDIASSASLIVLLLPALALISLCVASSGFPILYGHERVGRGGKPFRCLKFRTMVINSDFALADLLAKDPEAAREWRQNFKLANDPRITAVGKFLRKTSLDELPQLINVLRGDMSLVGPRPVVAKEIKLYYGEDAFYYELVRPGVTGLWQVSGRSQTSYSRRVSLDANYVRNWSLWTDLMILFSTIPSVIAGSGAR